MEAAIQNIEIEEEKRQQQQQTAHSSHTTLHSKQMTIIQNIITASVEL